MYTINAQKKTELKVKPCGESRRKGESNKLRGIQWKMRIYRRKDDINFCYFLFGIRKRWNNE